MTAQEFNRYTGRAKLLAKDEPLFVTERGAVRYVLLNIEDYNDLQPLEKRMTLADWAGASKSANIEFDLNDFIPPRNLDTQRQVVFDD
jgi:hypothetical protein